MRTRVQKTYYQCSHYPNEPSCDAKQTWVCTKSASVKAPYINKQASKPSLPDSMCNIASLDLNEILSEWVDGLWVRYAKRFWFRFSVVLKSIHQNTREFYGK